jgi:hypothetical protein
MNYNSLLEKKGFFVYGRKGQIIMIINMQEEPQEYLKFPSLVQNDLEYLWGNMDSGRFSKIIRESDPTDFEEQMMSWLTKLYLDWDNFGSFGDAMFLTRRELEEDLFLFDVTFIGRLGFPLPGLAADLLPFVVDKKGNKFLICIVRGKDPNKGMPALIGGGREVHGMKLHTPLETVIKEGWEETKTTIKIKEGAEHLLSQIPFPKQVPVDIYLNNKMGPIRSVLYLVGTFGTSDEEAVLFGNRISALPQKRIYETTAYTTLLKLDCEITSKELESMFQAGDDAAEIFIVNLDSRLPEFAFKHHVEIFSKATEIIFPKR